MGHSTTNPTDPNGARPRPAWKSVPDEAEGVQLLAKL